MSLPQIDRYQVSLKVFLRNPQGEILVLDTPENSTFGGYGDIPGGRIDIQEFTTPLEEIVRREIREETGITELVLSPGIVAYGRHEIPIGFQGGTAPIRVMYLFFEASITSADVQISHEHTSYRWIKLTVDNIEQLFTSGILEGARMYLNRTT